MNSVILKVEDHIATVTLNRPQRRNALNEEMVGETSQVLAEVSRDDGVRVVILTGAGQDFSVGADLGTGEGHERLVIEEPSAEAVRRGLLRSGVVRHLHG